jgi:hypothetical protein
MDRNPNLLRISNREMSPFLYKSVLCARKSSFSFSVFVIRFTESAFLNLMYMMHWCFVMTSRNVKIEGYGVYNCSLKWQWNDSHSLVVRRLSEGSSETDLYRNGEISRLEYLKTLGFRFRARTDVWNVDYFEITTLIRVPCLYERFWCLVIFIKSRFHVF